MAYDVQMTAQASHDLDVILDYIVKELANVDAAVRLMDEAERLYRLLADHPCLYAECQQPLLQRSHYRKAVISGYLFIYRVDESKRIVYIERFFSDLEAYQAKL